MIDSPRQLSLGVALNDEATLSNFYAPDHLPLAQIVSVLRDRLIAGEEQFLYLWGAPGAGVTHLLQAACHQAIDAGLDVQYLPLDEMKEYPPQALLDGMEQMSLVCLDNLRAVAGLPEWEQALFDLFNRIRDIGTRLLVGADATARELAVQLPDLQSRLSWGVTFQLPALADDDKVELLRFRAEQRGMEISENAARYILNHAPRDMGELITALNQLDSASLAAQRKLTIPFIKETLNG